MFEIDNSLAELYNFILAYKRKHQGNTPTIERMRSGCEISSTSVVSYRLDKLVDAGKITRTGRNIYIPGAVWTLAITEKRGRS